MGQIFCSRGRPLDNSRGRPVEFTRRPVNSTGRPLEFSRGRPLEQKIWPNIPTLKKVTNQLLGRVLCSYQQWVIDLLQFATFGWKNSAVASARLPHCSTFWKKNLQFKQAQIDYNILHLFSNRGICDIVIEAGVNHAPAYAHPIYCTVFSIFSPLSCCGDNGPICSKRTISMLSASCWVFGARSAAAVAAETKT